MTSMRYHGNSDRDKIHRTRNLCLSLATVWISISFITFFCYIYFKLKGVTIEKSN